jgi:hypothetical protein
MNSKRSIIRKTLILLMSLLGLSIVFLSGCSSDDDPVLKDLIASAGTDQTVEIFDEVTLDGSGSSDPESQTITYVWDVTQGPAGSSITLTGFNTATATFIPDVAGTYVAELTITAGTRTKTATVSITAEDPQFTQIDQMGRPAISTVFNFFAEGTAKDNFNLQIPSVDGAGNGTNFKGIFDALQTYIFLDPATFTNVLGLNNTSTGSTLGVDVLNCNKAASSTYGPSDLNNIVLFNNVLNGRKLSDDVVDVTLILTFTPTDATNTGNNVYPGVSTDNVDGNDKSFLTTFPYLADPH